jgi:hypothetical protein
MTRINVVPEQELSDKHLAGEYHEISRVFELVRKFLQRGGSIAFPAEYVLGEGHVPFFYRRLGYIAARYARLALEMRYRAFQRGKESAVQMHVVLEIIQCARDSITDERWWQDYIPTPYALEINRARLEERS